MEVQDSFLQALWLQQLSPRVQVVMQAQLELPLHELAEIVDRIIEVFLPQLSPTIQAIAILLNTTELAHRTVCIDRQLSCTQQRIGK